MAENSCDVLVVGGSLGGVAAALAATRAGKSVILLTPSDWVGGQMTSQGVCTPDENEYVETTGSTRSYREFRQRTRRYYEAAPFTLSAFGQARVAEIGHLNLGESWVSEGYSVEPKVGATILRQMLGEPGVQVMTGIIVTDITLSPDTNTVVGVAATAADGSTLHLSASFVLDATDLGDLLPLANVEHFVGAESQAQTGEPDAAADGPHRAWIQPFTYPIALEKRPNGEIHTIAKPASYEAVRDAQQFTLVDGNINGLFVARPLPNHKGIGEVFWTYRRVVEAALFAPGAGPFAGDVATINVGSNDFLDDAVPSGDPSRDVAALTAARQLSLCYLYWLQTECPRDPGDGSGTGYPNLRPVTEFWDTPDGIAPDPYVREGRRIQAMTTVAEQDIAVEDANNHDLQAGPRARLYADSCGIGHYYMDVHANHLGQQELFLATWPYQIPLGSLVPVRVTNLLPACKNIGVTHLTNGAYRLHPIEWNVGEAAGTLAAFCLDQGVTPQTVAQNAGLTLSYQTILVGMGVPLFWWTDLVDTDPAFAAAHLLGVQGVFTGEAGLNFAPDDMLTEGEKVALAEKVAPRVVSWPEGPVTRREAALLLI